MKAFITRTQVILLALLSAIMTTAMLPAAAYAAAGPDLAVTEITLSPAEPAIGDAVIITAAIKNLGGTATTASYTTCYIDDSVLATQPSGVILPGITTTVSFSWTATGGSHTIKVISDAGSTIPESDEDNNSRTYSITTSAPDLTVQSITWQPLNPSRGNTVVLSVTIENRGNISSQYTSVNLYIDGGTRVPQDVANIEPGGIITKTFSWTMLEGSHDLRAVIDENNNNKESDETNNALTATLGTLPADLTIGNISWAPVNPSKDDMVTFNVTVTNIGAGRAGQSYLGYYIDGTFLNMILVPELAAATSHNVTITWKATLDAHAIKVVADYYTMVNESNEENNIRETSLAAIPPDLIISKVTWNPLDPAAGDAVTFKIYVKNQGGGRADPSRLLFRIGIEAPVYLNFPSLAAGAEVSKETVWTAASGTFHLSIHEDDQLKIVESIDNNNRYDTELTVLPPDLFIPRITYYPKKPVLGETVSFNVTVTNQGKGKAPQVNICYFIDDESQTTGIVNALKSGASANVTFKWKITNGHHIFKAMLDYGNMLAEGNEKNNTASIAIAPNMPDLSITNVTWTPAEIPAGEDIVFVFDIENLGGVTAGPTRLVYYADDVIAGFNDIESILPRAKVNQSFTWPSSGGQHNITISADSKDQITEIDETNNTVTIKVPPPDLTVQEVSYSPQDAVSGATVDISASITNNRGSTSPASSVMFYVDGSSIGAKPLPALEDGQTAAVTFPWTAEPGTHTFKVVADIYKTVMETDETNNEASTEYVTSTPDLVVDNIRWVTQNTANSREINLIITVKNAGGCDSGAFSVQCSFDSAATVTREMASLNGGETAELNIETILSDGPHTARILLDTEKEVTEANEDNNNSTHTFTTLAPDLIIRSITWAPMTAETGDNITITAKIENLGESPAEKIELALKVDGAEAGYVEIPAIESGATALADFSWTAAAGSHTIDILADTAQTITESNETNNARSRTIAFSKPEAAEKKTPVITTNATEGGSLLDNWWWMLLLAGAALGLGVLYTTIRNMRKK
jgi:subtilase family serine protease